MAPEEPKEPPTVENFLHHVQPGLGSGPRVLYAPKENTGVFARLSQLGKVHRAQGCYQKLQAEGHMGRGWECSSAMGPSALPSAPCSRLPETPKLLWAGILQQPTKETPSMVNK